jgi:hypothetical protein
MAWLKPRSFVPTERLRVAVIGGGVCMMLFLALLAGFISTLLAGALTHWIFKHFASDGAARIGAFWLSFGAAGGRHSFERPFGSEDLPGFLALCGAALGLAILWYWLLKRPEHRTSH